MVLFTHDIKIHQKDQKGTSDKNSAKNSTCKRSLYRSLKTGFIALQDRRIGREIFWWEKIKVFAILICPTKDICVDYENI